MNGKEKIVSAWIREEATGGLIRARTTILGSTCNTPLWV